MLNFCQIFIYIFFQIYINMMCVCCNHVLYMCKRIIDIGKVVPRICSGEIRLLFAWIALFHIVHRPIHGFILCAESSGVVRRIPGVVGRRCIISPEGQVDEGETASGKHGDAVLALVAGFMCPSVRVMLLWLEGEHSFQWKSATKGVTFNLRIMYWSVYVTNYTSKSKILENWRREIQLFFLYHPWEVLFRKYFWKNDGMISQKAILRRKSLRFLESRVLEMISRLFVMVDYEIIEGIFPRVHWIARAILKRLTCLISHHMRCESGDNILFFIRKMFCHFYSNYIKSKEN